MCHNNKDYNYKFVDYGGVQQFLRWSLSVITFRKHR
jgi:cytochrome c oxidase subunit IV